MNDEQEVRLRVVEKLIECRLSVELFNNPCKITTVADALAKFIMGTVPEQKPERKRRLGADNGD